MMVPEETYRKVNFEGNLNMGFEENEVTRSSNGKEGLTKDNRIDEKFVECKDQKTITPAISYWKLFRFATRFEKFLIAVVVICVSSSSLVLPISIVLYGEFTAVIVDREIRVGTSTETKIISFFGGGRILTNATDQETYDALIEDGEAFVRGNLAIVLIELIFIGLSIDILNSSARRQVSRIRKLFLQSVLRQDMTWYDLNTSESFAAKISDDLNKLKEGIGEKLAIFSHQLMSFVFSVVFSFIYGWKLTLVMLSCVPLLIIAEAVVEKFQSNLSRNEMRSYSRAGAIAEEVFGSIRTVIAFGGEKKELLRYEERLKTAEKSGENKGIYSGIGGGVLWFIVYCSYALAFWYGVSLIIEDRDKIEKEYTPAVLIIVLFGLLAGAQNMGITTPHLEAFAAARGSAVSVFSVIDRIPTIDSLSEEGKKPTNVVGNIKFSKVTFSYPSRVDVQVLNELNMIIEAGKTVALVGPSGCGKSTCLQLIQQLYNPTTGSISIDDVPITEWNTRHLRSLIGVVGQEPVLFSTTIRENIRYGNPDANDDEIERAARIANCHQFIMKLPEGYETWIGERGAQLSGGQKQRIAIARALIKNPKILILDEATSALDHSSEKKIQKALESASKGRTTLVVSHRLSTITNADKIIYIDNGIVVEQGTHSELMEAKGFYFELVNTNKSSKEDDSVKKRKRQFSEQSEVSLDDEINEKEEKLEEEEISEEDKKKVSTFALMKLNSKEWPYIVVGTISSCCVGASFPIFAILFGSVYGSLSFSDPVEVQNETNFYSFLFIGLGVFTGVSTFLQCYTFTFAGVKLTSRLRSKTFEAMMRQEIGWFDDAHNAVGALCSRLSVDCANVQGATGSKIGSMVQAASLVIIGLAISIYYNWKMALVSSIAIPIIIIPIIFEARFAESSSAKEKSAMENATKIAVEAISNIRTIASLGQEPHVLQRYSKEIDSANKYSKKKSKFRGFVFGLGNTIPLVGYSISLYYGVYLLANKEIIYEDVLKISEALIFGSWMLGIALAYAPNVNEAVISASRIMKLLTRNPNSLNPSPLADKDYDKSDGNIDYKDVAFRYPTRMGVQVLNGLNLLVENGKTIALVGPSGCGKSTVMQLLLRFYDPEAGEVLVDNIATIDYPLSRIRAKIGLVSQEPVLFDRTIAENIAYGSNERKIPMAEIIEAAKQANIHDFISMLPQGYETGLGLRGTSLSGGQKQRIAIARALVRNPHILLLDEATSALDNQSEKVVQVALDQARSGRTTITIAHRLTTIQNADLICVLENGEIVEMGSHEELMNKGEKYAKLFQMQQVH